MQALALAARTICVARKPAFYFIGFDPRDRKDRMAGRRRRAPSASTCSNLPFRGVAETAGPSAVARRTGGARRSSARPRL